jgi:hypothetical protein
MEELDQLATRVVELTGLNERAASMVAASLMSESVPDAVFSAADIVREAEKLGYEFEKRGKASDKLAAPDREVTMDPVEVLAEVYRTCPRVLTQEVPRVGRAPKDSVFYDAELQAMIDSLPEEIRLLIAGIDLVNGQVNVTLYDEANDVDRTIGPLSLDRYDSRHALEEALRVLMRRLPRVLSSDFN